MAELDTKKISIIEARKVNPKVLAEIGDQASNLPKSVQVKNAQEKRCNLCCMSIGMIFSVMMVLMVAGISTGLSIVAEKRVNYTLNGVMRQIGWISLPGILAGTTMHYFLSEAMWSNKRNTWGQAWMKAMAFNSVAWCSAIGAGTLFWRKILLLTPTGRRLYYRYPIPTEPLEYRVLRTPGEFFTGMGWSYWLSGVASGQVGFFSCVTFCVWNDRPYFMMSPTGGYAARCTPRWRREQLAKEANIQIREN